MLRRGSGYEDLPMADLARWENEGGALGRPAWADAADEVRWSASDGAATERAAPRRDRSESGAAQAGSAPATSGPTTLRATRAAREAWSSSCR